MGLRNRVAVVTGSTSGIGLGIAHALAADGIDIMLNGFGSDAEIAALKDHLGRTHGVAVSHHPADMTKPADIADLIAATASELGGPNILVNNAGIQFTAAIKEFPHERWEAVIAINLSAVFYAMQAAIPIMQAARWGRIINIASAHGLVASTQKAAYVAAKHGVLGLTKVAALELADYGVTCNAICPGWVLTPLVQKQINTRADREGSSPDNVAQAMLTEKQPLAKFTTPEQIGALTLFLCSEAACTITGAPLSIDGGWTAR